MPTDTKAAKNWFNRGGQAYARFRPEYPPELARFLAETAISRERAANLGCRNGQLTGQLAAYFDDVVGLDPSADQIANAAAQEHVRYILRLPRRRLCRTAVSVWSPRRRRRTGLISRFYAEARRIAVDRAVIALISCGVLQLHGGLQEKDNPVTRMSKRWRAPALKRRYNEVHEAGSLSTS